MLDLITSIKATLYNRISSPLSGTLIITSLLSNYRMTFLVFSSLDYDEKINRMNEIICDWSYVAIHILGIPITATLIYFFIYPHLEKRIYEHNLKNKKNLLDIRNAIEENTLLSVKQSKEILARVRKAEFEYDSDINKKEEEIKQLSEKIKNLEDELEDKKKTKNQTSFKSKLELDINESIKDPLQSKILKYMFDSINNRKTPNKEISQVSIFRHIEGEKSYNIEVAIDKLKNKNIIIVSYNGHNNYTMEAETMSILDKIYSEEMTLENI